MACFFLFSEFIVHHRLFFKELVDTNSGSIRNNTIPNVKTNQLFIAKVSFQLMLNSVCYSTRMTKNQFNKE